MSLMTTQVVKADSLIPKVNAVPTVEAYISNATETNRYDSPLASCAAYYSGEKSFANQCRYGEVPPQVAIWLFLVAIFGFIGFLNRNKL